MRTAEKIMWVVAALGFLTGLVGLVQRIILCKKRSCAASISWPGHTGLTIRRV